jgi:hypothetical protein
MVRHITLLSHIPSRRANEVTNLHPPGSKSLYSSGLRGPRLRPKMNYEHRPRPS